MIAILKNSTRNRQSCLLKAALSSAAAVLLLLSGIAALGADAPKDAAPRGFVMETGKPIEGLAVIQPAGHRGSTTIAVAHGEAGAAIYSHDGSVIWKDESEAALLVSYYPGTLLIYRKHDEPGGRVDRYDYAPGAPPRLAATEIPAAPAATTMQRTAYSVLGPVRIDGKEILLSGGRVIHAAEPVTVVAASKYFIPVIAETTILYATQSGRIYVMPFEEAASVQEETGNE